MISRLFFFAAALLCLLAAFGVGSGNVLGWAGVGCLAFGFAVQEPLR